MILSNVEIQRALDSGRLSIVPEPTPRQADTERGVSCPYQTTSVDLRLGHEISYLKDNRPISIDLQRGRFADLFRDNSETQSIRRDQPVPLLPNRFVLGRTLERISLPLSANPPVLAARVEGKSSYARCGLLIHFTAPTIHAGFQGTITLELINLGPYPILLYPEAPICQLVLEEVSGIPFANESQFQRQSRPSGDSA